MVFMSVRQLVEQPLSQIDTRIRPSLDSLCNCTSPFHMRNTNCSMRFPQVLVLSCLGLYVPFPSLLIKANWISCSEPKQHLRHRRCCEWLHFWPRFISTWRLSSSSLCLVCLALPWHTSALRMCLLSNAFPLLMASTVGARTLRCSPISEKLRYGSP
jgi:hypothetical protein